jgi:hypothetical protein
VLSVLAGVGVVAYALWSGGFIAWLAIPLGALFIVGNGYWLIRDKSRLALSATGMEWGFEWSRRSLAWAEVESMRVRRGGGLLTRRHVRWLEIEVRGDAERARLSRGLSRADVTVNLSGLERSAEAVVGLVEQYSGREIER